MREFFRGWKRKIGVLTLLLTCALTVEWVRSFTFCDGAAVTFIKHRYSVRSYRNQILWDSQHVNDGRLYHPFFRYFSVVIAKLSQPHQDPLVELPNREWSLVVGDFYLAKGAYRAGHPSLFVPKPGPPVPVSTIIAQTPYWSIVVPLILLSAWLILSKPKPEMPTEAQRATGT
jgi:hypothetical protein